MFWLSTLAADSSYAAHVMPALFVTSFGGPLVVSETESEAPLSPDPPPAPLSAVSVATWVESASSMLPAVAVPAEASLSRIAGTCDRSSWW